MTCRNAYFWSKLFRGGINFKYSRKIFGNCRIMRFVPYLNAFFVLMPSNEKYSRWSVWWSTSWLRNLISLIKYFCCFKKKKFTNWPSERFLRSFVAQFTAKHEVSFLINSHHRQRQGARCKRLVGGRRSCYFDVEATSAEFALWCELAWCAYCEVWNLYSSLQYCWHIVLQDCLHY